MKSKSKSQNKTYIVTIDDPCDPVEYLINALMVKIDEKILCNLLNLYTLNDYVGLSNYDGEWDVYKFGRLRVEKFKE